MNKPVILSRNWQKICERARIIPIFIKYVGVHVMANKAEQNIKNICLWAEPEPVCILFLLILLLPYVILDLDTVKLSVRII